MRRWVGVGRLPRWDGHVAAILLVALALRVAVWWTLPYRDFISDEAEYWGAAVWLAQGRGFSFFDGWIWTRPPVYVLFLALHVWVAGPTALPWARATQTLLSVALVALVMLLARRLAPATRERRVMLLAGWAMALSYSFATFGYLLLNETLFLCLFVPGVWALTVWAATRRRRWLVLAGGLLGLAVLTKALTLTWLPLVALWVWLRAQHGVAQRWRALAPVAVLTASVCVVVVPWSAYATLRWSHGHGLILVDTTGGYNFALGAQTGYLGRRDSQALHDQLCDGSRCDAQQAARQQRAYALGWQWIRAAPAGFVRKTGQELLDMVQIQYGGAERLRAGHTLGAVPLPHLLGLLADDTLYVVALALAPLGLLRRQCRPGKGLVVSWLAYNIAVGALVFAINRFRQPLLPCVFIYAACAVAQWRWSWPTRWRQSWAYALSAALLLLVLPSYLYWPPLLGTTRQSSWQHTLYGLRGLRLAAECTAIERVLAAGDVATARRLHDAASARRPRPCLALINARLLEAEGKIDGPDGALAFLARSAPSDDTAQAAKILLLEGDLLRRLGRLEAARERFAARAVEITNDLDWSWRELDPPPTTRIDLGSGLDEGYIRGFYKREYSDAADPFGTGFRWSGPQAWLRFPQAGTGRPQTLVLRVNGYTNTRTPTRVQPFLDATALPAITLQPGWQELRLELPPTPPGADVVVRFASSVFVDGPRDLAERTRAESSQPLRLLGFQLDWAELRPR